MVVNRLTEKLDFEGARQLHNKHRLLFPRRRIPIPQAYGDFRRRPSYMAGFGLKAYLITQDIRQIVDEYGPNESIVSNCQVRVAFAPTNTKLPNYSAKWRVFRPSRKPPLHFLVRECPQSQTTSIRASWRSSVPPDTG